MLCNVDRIGANGTVQSFVEQQIGFFGKILPIGEFPGGHSEYVRFGLVMNVVPSAPGTGFAVLPEHRLEFFEQVGFRPEVTEIRITRCFRFRHDLFHFLTVEAVKRVAFNKTGIDVFTHENLFKRGNVNACFIEGDAFSRMKICSNVVLTVLVPAPEEPVIDRMGKRRDIRLSH